MSLCVATEYVWWPFDGRVMTSAVQLVRSEKEPGRLARTVASCKSVSIRRGARDACPCRCDAAARTALGLAHITQGLLNARLHDLTIAYAYPISLSDDVILDRSMIDQSDRSPTTKSECDRVAIGRMIRSPPSPSRRPTSYSLIKNKIHVIQDYLESGRGGSRLARALASPVRRGDAARTRSLCLRS